MSEFTQVLLIANLYRFLMIVAGVIFMFFGYRLFRIGFYEKAGELKAIWGDRHLVLKQVGPGVFFALFGTIVMIAAVARGIVVERPAEPVGAGLFSFPVLNPDTSSARESRPIDPLVVLRAFDCTHVTQKECDAVNSWLQRQLHGPQQGAGLFLQGMRSPTAKPDDYKVTEHPRPDR